MLPMITPNVTLATSSINAGNDATITFRLPQEQKDALESLAREQGIKLSRLIKEMLEAASIQSAQRIVCQNTTPQP